MGEKLSTLHPPRQRYRWLTRGYITPVWGTARRQQWDPAPRLGWPLLLKGDEVALPSSFSIPSETF